MTPKQRSAHRNAQRSRLKGRAMLRPIQILRLNRSLGWDRQLQKMWDFASRWGTGRAGFLECASSYDRLVAHYAMGGTVLYLNVEEEGIEARLLMSLDLHKSDSRLCGKLD